MRTGGIGVGSHVIVAKTDTAFGTYISSEGIAPSDNYGLVLFVN